MPTYATRAGAIHYEDVGTSESVVLLLHAFPLHSGMWRAEIAALAKRHRVIAPDYPGLGRSAPRVDPSTMESIAVDVSALLDTLGVTRAVVVGLSMGGYVALELHRRRRSLFRGLVLADTRAGADTPEGAAGREAFARDALAKGLDWVADAMMPKLLGPAAGPEVVERVRALVRGGTPEGVAAGQRGLARRPDSSATLGEIACPTLVVVGADDTLTPPSEAEKLAAGVRGAKLVTLAGAGHLSNLEQPAAFDEALVGFVDGLSR